MKRIGALTICVLLFTGCHSNTYQDENIKKKSKIEIYSIQNDKLLVSIDNQEVINQLLVLDAEDGETVTNLPNDLIPEYELHVYQEMTLRYGEDPDEPRDYELIATITTFQNSSYVEEVIASDIVTNITVPEGALSFYYLWSDDTIERFHGLFE